MCMGASAGPSKAVVAQEAENARLAEERLNEKRAALQNPFDRIPDEVKKLCFNFYHQVSIIDFIFNEIRYKQLFF